MRHGSWDVQLKPSDGTSARCGLLESQRCATAKCLTKKRVDCALFPMAFPGHTACRLTLWPDHEIAGVGVAWQRAQQQRQHKKAVSRSGTVVLHYPQRICRKRFGQCHDIGNGGRCAVPRT